MASADAAAVSTRVQAELAAEVALRQLTITSVPVEEAAATQSAQAAQFAAATSLQRTQTALADAAKQAPRGRMRRL